MSLLAHRLASPIKIQALGSCLAQQAPPHRDHSVVRSAPPTHTPPPRENKTKNHLRQILHQRTGRGSRVLVNHVQGSGSHPHHHPKTPRVTRYGLRESELLSRNTEHSMGSRGMSPESKPISGTWGHTRWIVSKAEATQ